MDAFDALMERAMAESIPLFGHLELTARCNLQCVHCYVPPVGNADGELETAEWIDVLDQLAAHNGLFLTFSGGEPLLRPDMIEIAAAAVDRGFAYRVFTNGTLVDEDLVEALHRRPPVAVEVSVYGTDSRTHDGITRVPGSFDRTLRGIRLLVQRGVRVVAKSPMMRENYGQLVAMREQAARLGCEFTYDAMIMARVDGDDAPLAHRLSDDGYRALIAAGEDSAQRASDIDLDQPFCNAGRTRVCVGPTGEVYPCVALQISAGNLRRQPFSEIWRTGGILRQFRSATRRDARGCVDCPYIAYCMRCPGMAYVEDGDWKGPSSGACQLARVRYEWDQEASVTKNMLSAQGEMCYDTLSEGESTLKTRADVFAREREGGCPE